MCMRHSRGSPALSSRANASTRRSAVCRCSAAHARTAAAVLQPVEDARRQRGAATQPRAAGRAPRRAPARSQGAAGGRQARWAGRRPGAGGARAVQEAAAVVGRDLQQEGVLEVARQAGPAPELVLAGRAGADRLQAPLEQRPVRGHAHRQLHLEDHEAPAPVGGHVACARAGRRQDEGAGLGDARRQLHPEHHARTAPHPCSARSVASEA